MATTSWNRPENKHLVLKLSHYFKNYNRDTLGCSVSLLVGKLSQLQKQVVSTIDGRKSLRISRTIAFNPVFRISACRLGQQLLALKTHLRGTKKRKVKALWTWGTLTYLRNKNHKNFLVKIVRHLCTVIMEGFASQSWGVSTDFMRAHARVSRI